MTVLLIFFEEYYPLLKDFEKIQKNQKYSSHGEKEKWGELLT